RLVLRQVRSLDPGLGHIGDFARDLEAPRDVVMRAASIVRVDCPATATPEGTLERASWTEVLTDPVVQPDMGFAKRPFVVGTARANTDGCKRTILYQSPRQALLDVIASGSAFVVVG
ncbi:MAG TPA: hypothetical protein PLV68_01670, partial [Ilumatobacteraceae bacterium]|nr:hypothetical protein [Ilumatobacteraceae bacterium]